VIKDGSQKCQRITVQKSYKQLGIVGILGLVGTRKINKLRVINNPEGFDPDHVHHRIKNLRTHHETLARKFQRVSATCGFSLCSWLIASTIAFTLSGISCV
jgi:hypothetical protein